MRPFDYASPTTADQVPALLGKSWGEVEILAGGSDLLSLMKDEITTPKRLVNIKYISLPNLIMDKPLVKELVQDDFTVKNIAAELDKLLHDEAYRHRIISGYDELIRHLGGTGASARVAQYILDDAKHGTQS